MNWYMRNSSSPFFKTNWFQVMIFWVRWQFHKALKLQIFKLFPSFMESTCWPLTQYKGRGLPESLFKCSSISVLCWNSGHVFFPDTTSHTLLFSCHADTVLSCSTFTQWIHSAKKLPACGLHLSVFHLIVHWRWYRKKHLARHKPPSCIQMFMASALHSIIVLALWITMPCVFSIFCLKSIWRH